MSDLELVKKIVGESPTFKIIDGETYFPPLKVMNDFLIQGHDPADQDDLYPRWNPFEIDENTYRQLKLWWITDNPDAKEDWLGLNESESHLWFTEAYDRI